MEAVNGEGHGQGEEPGTFKQGRNEKSPVMLSSSLPDTQNPHRPDKRPDMIEPKLGYFLWLVRPVLFEECPDSLIILFRGINSTQDILIAINQCFVVHPGNEVEGAVHIVSRKPL